MGCYSITSLRAIILRASSLAVGPEKRKAVIRVEAVFAIDCIKAPRTKYIRLVFASLGKNRQPRTSAATNASECFEEKVTVR
jgi:hypothetical protein